MNYGKMFFSVLLLPAVICGNSDVEIRENRIKQLENDCFKKEEEISCLSARMHDESGRYHNYINNALKYWNPDCDKEACLYEFISQLSDAFEADEDINVLSENNPFVKKDPTAYWAMIRATMQLVFIRTLGFQYNQLVHELIEIKNELKKLQGGIDVLQ